MIEFRRHSTKLAGLAVIAITTLGLATTMHARPGDGDAGCRGGKGKGFVRAIESLDLDADTRAQVDALFEDARSDKEALRGEIREAREVMRSLMSEAEPQEDAVLAQADAIAELMGEKHRQRVATMLEVRRLVGTEAWAELQAMREAKRERRGRRSETGETL